MRDEVLIKITQVTDDSTGYYVVGELDFGIPGTTFDWLKNPKNRERLAAWMEKLAKDCRQKTGAFHEI